MKKDKTIFKKMDKLLGEGFIWEVIYLEWLVNMVMVKKVNGEWISDFINLDNAFLKHNFPLPKVDNIDTTKSLSSQAPHMLT